MSTMIVPAARQFRNRNRRGCAAPLRPLLNQQRFRTGAQAAFISSLLLAVGGCFTARADERQAGEAQSPQVDTASALRRALQREAGREFKSAHYTKPDLPALGDPWDALAPLIVREADSGARDRHERPLGFGVVFVDDNGRVRVDASQPTVYAGQRTVEHGGRTWHQIGYFWWYAGQKNGDSDSPPHVQGVVMTLDESGYPFLWEPVRATADVRAIFVSSSFERIARFPARAAITKRAKKGERREGAPIIQVAVIETTPVPTGPYVYLDPRNRVTSILCRCSPTQVDAFVTEHEYTLRPLSDVQAGSLTPAKLGLAWDADDPAGESARESRSWRPLIPAPVSPASKAP